MVVECHGCCSSLLAARNELGLPVIGNVDPESRSALLPREQGLSELDHGSLVTASVRGTNEISRPSDG